MDTGFASTFQMSSLFGSYFSPNYRPFVVLLETQCGSMYFCAVTEAFFVTLALLLATGSLSYQMSFVVYNMSTKLLEKIVDTCKCGRKLLEMHKTQESVRDSILQRIEKFLVRPNYVKPLRFLIVFRSF